MIQVSADRLEHTVLAEQKMMASAPQSEQLARTPGSFSPKKSRLKSSVQITRLCDRREAKWATTEPWREREEWEGENRIERVSSKLKKVEFLEEEMSKQ